MENAWQYSKVYPQHQTCCGTPNELWEEWVKEGWANPRAVRYPMGRGAKPAYSYWNGEQLDYIDARKIIYAPLYYAAVKDTVAFAELRAVYESSILKEKDLWLLDFDVYDPKGKTYDQILNDPSRKMGHGFVLAGMLEGNLFWK